MPNYSVRVPFAGYVDVEVNADTPDEAADKALNEFPSLELPEGNKYADWSYEPMRMLQQGNITYVDHNEMTIYNNDTDEEVDWSPRRY